jgi:hypothetical protein
MNGMTKVWAMGRPSPAQIAYFCEEYWIASTNTAKEFSFEVYGMRMFRKRGTLADAASATILDIGGVGGRHAFITVASTGATTVASGVVVAHGTIIVYQMGASPNFQTTPAAGKLSVSLSGAALVLTNNQGESVDYDVAIDWR